MVRYEEGCILEVDVTSLNDDQSWVLGVPFGRTYCNVHDLGQKRIGFSRARTDLNRNRATNCGISCKGARHREGLLKSKSSNVTFDWPDDLVPWPTYKLDDVE